MIGLVFTWLLNLSLGSVAIPFSKIIHSITGTGTIKESWEHILWIYRLPKSITAILVGSGLGVAGLLMQTLFRNPLAGPYVLGLSSGASLGVALCIMGASLFGGLEFIFSQKWSYAIAASLGSFLVLLCVLLLSTRVKDHMAILIIGLMFASITAGIVSVLSFFASAEALQQYIFWGFGSLGNLSWHELYWFLGFYSMGILVSLTAIKALNSLQLGEAYAKSMGQNIQQSRFLIILGTSLLCGVITAFAGPIAFIGLAIPHLTRQLFKTSNHKILLPAVILLGSILMLICDTISQLPSSELMLPINAITALIGAPVIITLLIRNRKIVF
ncbi:iron chelate uptake ABC transporter family permease subunit [Aquimarina agarilytica]|uniref:iron chelate uptake ABC transporter family permease subunit n=1 Tax=Aquimarina agarilytica TaxID=1087449 RepID=UPI000681B42C